MNFQTKDVGFMIINKLSSQQVSSYTIESFISFMYVCMIVMIYLCTDLKTQLVTYTTLAILMSKCST